METNYHLVDKERLSRSGFILACPAGSEIVSIKCLIRDDEFNNKNTAFCCLDIF